MTIFVNGWHQLSDAIVKRMAPRAFEKAYSPGCNSAGERPYQLLSTVLREKNRAALAMYDGRRR